MSTESPKDYVTIGDVKDVYHAAVSQEPDADIEFEHLPAGHFAELLAMTMKEPKHAGKQEL